MDERQTYRIALVQMRSEKAAIAQNLKAMERFVAESSSQEAGIVCFPEMNITGYIDPGKYPEAVIGMEHPAILEAVEISGRYGVCLIAGLVEHNPAGKPFITQFVADHGSLLGTYRKKTIKDGEEAWFAPGDRLPVFSVSGLTFGLAVCADIDDRDIFKEHAAQGAEVVFELAAPGLYGAQETRDWSSGFNWWRGKCIDQLGVYAAELRIPIAVATQAGRTVDEDFPGGGYWFNADGNLEAETVNGDESILYADLT
ncbi:carbon-nitrogen hydrolase family protein [Paenibacillus sp. NFR01]|uniref:carbon-nitrogen hydrolase family protein n=1 Tax=Paenibacillus sp. NFR01 TaxID=1566279 RepID=UPI0008BD29C4|nr:carbon-nitrogen hydrolase family protein [Paenibacillus sp. NFR01]SEU01866.1 Predicted amidohydrolase [Paenibacillus sp. NFR01]